jgi:alkylresorcinol/alkylpyrone synthase
MSTILAVQKLLPPHRYTQQELADAFSEELKVEGPMRELLYQLFDGTTVRTRHLALPIPEYRELNSFRDSNNRHQQLALDYAEQAIRSALDTAGVDPHEVDMLITQSVTGISVPPFDIGLIDRLGLRRDVKRMPLFGFGCGGGGAALARLHDYLRAWPGHTAVLVSAELCSMTVQRGVRTSENLLGAALCGDAVASVVACGADAAVARGVDGPRIQATRSHFYPDSTHMAGWRIGENGFEVVLHRGLPDEFAKHVGGDVQAFLGDHGLTTDEITAWPCHPGGPKVLDGVTKAVGLADDALDRSRRHLADCGNCSSASVLHVLADSIEDQPPRGTPGVLMSFGPGLFSELVLLRW